MIPFSLIDDLSSALDMYKAATVNLNDSQAREDFGRLTSIAESVIDAMKRGDDDQIKIGILGFSRQVSDSLSTQPPQFKELAKKMASVRRIF